MKICMTGIDYKNSELFVREKFAVTKNTAEIIMSEFIKIPYIEGCVIISTCNRTEVYASIHKSQDFCISKFLCGVLNMDFSQYISRFIERDEADTFYHLCAVASGIDSQILGDDQIITQVRESLELSRGFGFTDSYIETMFRTAIKAAKEIKTNIKVRSERTSSAPHKAVEKLKSVCGLYGKTVTVIGNGQMGRLATELLLKESSIVTVTLREYRKGKIIVPEGAHTISYSDRYNAIVNSDIVLSATTSPHYTVKYEEFVNLQKKPYIIVDLAVPRDIDPKTATISGIALYTIDDLVDDDNSLPEDKIELANKIIDDNMQNYYKWREFKEKNK